MSNKTGLNPKYNFFKWRGGGLNDKNKLHRNFDNVLKYALFSFQFSFTLLYYSKNLLHILYSMVVNWLNAVVLLSIVALVMNLVVIA
jgi:hypothetical protein